MATLQKIRNKAGLLAIIIGLALFAFIIGDFLNSGSSLFKQSQRKIASIGDYSLDVEEYEARIQEMLDVYKVQTGKSNLEEEIVSQIRESVYESIVREKLLDQQAEELGIAVTGKELFQMVNGVNVHPMVQQLPIFQNPQTGMFDRSVMMNFLKTIQSEDLSAYPAEAQQQIAELKKYWLFWENNLKYNRLEEKINMLLSKAVQANSLDAKASYASRSNNIDFIYTFQPYTSLSDSLFKASKGDVKKRYNAQIEKFAQKPYRSAKYVLVEVKASDEDYKAVETSINKLESDFIAATDLTAFVNQNSDNQYFDCYLSNALFEGKVKEFINTSSVGGYLPPVFDLGAFQMAKIVAKTVAPDSVKVKNMVLGSDEAVRADSIMAVLKAGANFNQIAQQFSRSAQAADMGWFREIDAQSMGKEFVNACFAAPVNQYQMVKGKNSINIFQVTEKTAPVAKTKIALVSLKVTPSSRTYSAAYGKLNQLKVANTKAQTFVDAALKSGFEVMDAEIVRSNDFTLANIPQMRDAVRFVYNNELGDVSPIFENQNNQFLVVAITGVNDGEYQSLDLVSRSLENEIVNENKAEEIISNIKSKNAGSLTALASSINARIDTAKFVNFATRNIQSIGDEPALVAAVTSAPINKMSEPVKGKNGVYVFQVLSKLTSQEAFNPQQEIMGLNSMNSYRLVYQSFEAVKKAAKVKDSRIKFY